MHLIFIVLILLTGSSAFADWTGCVVDSDNKPLSGIGVSDGLNVVQTASDGSFSLPQREAARFLFVSTPAGMRAKDRFYAPIQAEKTDYTFVLEPFAPSQGETIRFIQVSDVEISGGQEIWIENLRQHAKIANCAFLISSGDICYPDGLKFNAQKVNSNTMGLPVYYSVGNHDLVSGKYGEELFEKQFGPCWYSFNAGPVHFVVTPMPSGDYRPSYSVVQVAQWLKNDLAQLPEGTPVVVFNHSAPAGGKFNSPAMFRYGSGENAIDMKSINLKAWLFGHYHTSVFDQNEETGTIFGSVAPPNKGGIDHSVGTFYVYTIGKSGIESIQTRSSYVDHHVAIAAFEKTAKLISAEESKTNQSSDKVPLHLLISAYDSAVPVEHAAYSIIGKNNKTDEKSEANQQDQTISNGTLNQVSPWIWEAACSFPTDFSEREISVQADIRFADGKTISVVRPLVDNSDAANAILTSLWTTNVGNETLFGEPIPFDGGTIVATADDGNRTRCAVIALDKTGAIRWKTKTNNSVKCAMATDGTRVFAMDQAWNVYALDGKTGEILWTDSQGAEPTPLIAAPIYRDGVLFAGQGNGLKAYQAATGKVLWQNTAWSGGEGTTARHSFFGNLLLVSANWRALYAHDPQTGKLLWSAKHDQLRFRSSAMVPLVDNTGREVILGASSLSLQTLDPNNGALLTSVKTSKNLQTASTPLIFDDLILVGSADSGLQAFDRATFQLLWEVKTGTNLIYSSPYTSPEQSTIEATAVRVGKYVVVGALDGYLYVIEPTRRSGTVVEKRNLGAPILSSAALAPDGKTLFVSDFGGNVHAFGLK